MFGPAWCARLAFSCLAMYGALYAAIARWPYRPEVSFSHRAGWMCAMIILGCGIYAAVTIILRCPEWTWIKGALRKKTEV